MGLILALFAAPAVWLFAGELTADAATIALLREQVAALTRRLDEMERRQAAQASAKADGAAVQNVVNEAEAATKQAQVAAAEANAAQRKLQASATGAIAPFVNAGPIEGLLPPEEMGSSSSGGRCLAFRLARDLVAHSGQQDRIARLRFLQGDGVQDFNARNQNDAPPVQTIPLNGSGADEQGGDFGMRRASAASVSIPGR